MKRILLGLSAFVFSANIAFSQSVTITDADFPIVNDDIMIIIDNSPNVTIGGSSTGQTWDLSGIAVDELDTLFFVDPTSIAGPTVTDATVALEEADRTVYFNNTTTEASVIALANVDYTISAGTFTANEIFFNPGDVLIKYPAMFGGSYNDTSHFDYKVDGTQFSMTANDSIWVKHDGYSTNVIDAEGDLTTKSNTFSTVRRYRTKIEIDSIFVYAGNPTTAALLGLPQGQWSFVSSQPGLVENNPLVDSTYQYTWYASGTRYPVAEMDVDKNDNVLQVRMQYDGSLIAAISSSSNATCNGASDGTITATGIGGATPYTYAWNNGSTDASITGLAAGNYGVTVTDNVSATYNLDVVLTEPSVVTATFSTTFETAAGSDGTATVSGSGGTSPYTYAWNTTPAQNTATATGLTAGAYNATVTDANSCTQVGSVTVSLQPSNVGITVTDTDLPNDGDSFTMITDTMPSVVAGSAGSGMTWDFSGLNAHIIDTTVYLDPAATAGAADFTASTMAKDGVQMDYYTKSATELTVDGFAGDPVGMGISVTVVYEDDELFMEFPTSYGSSFNDTMNFTYEMDGTAMGLSTTDSLRLIRNRYTLSSFDGEGTVTVPGATLATIRENKEQTTIDSLFIKTNNQQVADYLSIQCFCIWPLNQWKLAPTISGIIEESPMVTNDYSYNWYANGEGSAFVEMKVDQNDNPLEVTYIYQNALLAMLEGTTEIKCNGGSDGTADVFTMGGSTPIVYNWSNGESTEDAATLTAGVHTVTISDAASDSAEVTVTITEPQALVLTATLNSNATCGGCTDGSAQVSATGGVGTYNFTWSNGTSSFVNNALTGGANASVTVTDSNGCTDVQSIYISNVENISGQMAINFYPNPVVNGNLVIENAANTTVTVYNLLGEVVYNDNILADKHVLDLSGKVKGVYLVEVSADGNSTVAKITIQ